MDALSHQIIQRIKTTLDTIKIVNGAVKDIVTVSERKTTPYKITELPAINIIDTSSEVEKNGNNHTNILDVSLELKTTGVDHIKDSRNFCADIISVLGVDFCLGGLVQNMSTIITESIDDEQEGVKFTSVTLTFSVTYITKIFNKFGLA